MDAPSTASARTTTVEPAMWILAGLALAIVAGVIGTFFDAGSDGATVFYSLAGIGSLLAWPLLALRRGRAGSEFGSAGFIALTIVFSASSVAGFSGDGADQVLAAMGVLHLPPLLLVAVDDWAPVWSRAAAALSGVMFAAWGYMSLLGDDPVDGDSFVLVIAWVTFIIASIGWLLTAKDES